MSDKYDRTTHGDFQIYYDVAQKRNYWLLGYFGGGSVCISDAMELAKEYAEVNNVPLDTVKIDEVLYGRRYKHFKYLFSTDEQVPDINSMHLENVYKFITD